MLGKKHPAEGRNPGSDSPVVPFNSSRSYNVLFLESKSTEPPAQIRAFEDSWTWDRQAVETLDELTQTAPASLVNLLKCLRAVPGPFPYEVGTSTGFIQMSRANGNNSR